MNLIISKLLFLLSLLGVLQETFGSSSKTIIAPNCFEKIIFSAQEIAVLRKHLILRSLLPTNLHLIGHRGMGSTNGLKYLLSDSIPENTLESFKQAIICGADGIEFDIFETRDGHLLIIHDDELWKNIYSKDRSGLHLPGLETQHSFRVSQKDLADLLKLSVGPKGQNPPALSELFELIEEANRIRTSLKVPPLILNFDVKNSKVSLQCWEWIQSYLQKNKATTIDFSHIYFTSADPEALRSIHETTYIHPKSVNTALQITTEQIYGKENMGENYLVKNPFQFNLEYLESLKKMAQTHQIRGIDCVLWDINPLLINLCKDEHLELHLYTSNFEHTKHFQDFAPLIFSLSRVVPLYLKTDHLKEKLSILSREVIMKGPEDSPEDYFDKYFPLKKPACPPSSLK